MAGLKTAVFTVRADVRQSAGWKQASESHGHASVGTWLAEAADRYLDGLRRAGKPVSLCWRYGIFQAPAPGGERIPVRGLVSNPFAY